MHFGQNKKVKIATKDSISVLHRVVTVGIFFCPIIYIILSCLKIYSMCVYINLHLDFLHYKMIHLLESVTVHYFSIKATLQCTAVYTSVPTYLVKLIRISVFRIDP